MIELSDYFGKIEKESYKSYKFDGLKGINKVKNAKMSPTGVKTLFNLAFYRLKVNQKDLSTIVKTLNKNDVALDILLFNGRSKLEEKILYEKISKIICKLKKPIIALNLRAKPENHYNIVHTAMPSFLLKSRFEVIFINLIDLVNKKQLFTILKSGAKQIKFSINEGCEKLFEGISSSDVRKETKIQLIPSSNFEKNRNYFSHFSKVKEIFFNKISYFKIEINVNLDVKSNRVISNLLRIFPKIKGEIIYFVTLKSYYKYKVKFNLFIVKFIFIFS